MFTMMTVLRKRPEISTEEFHPFMRHEYGPTYVGLAETRAYTQYYLADVGTDGTEDAIVSISFDSAESMQTAMGHPTVAAAAQMRVRVMRESTVGIHPAVVEQAVHLVGAGGDGRPSAGA
jgi:hypothetical protein